MDTLTAQKKELRRRILQMRREFLATSAGERAAKIIVDKTIKSQHFQKAQKIMAYASQVGELPLYDFLQKAQSMGKEIFLPGRGEKPGEMFALRLRELVAALPPWGVWHEPTTKEILPPEELDLIIVPGAAFSFHGARLGMGGGYYDRFLPRAVGAYRLALAFDCQILPKIPTNIHDEKVDGIITETGSHHNRK